jgi:drug/metabolite transporter (DMT)-like permease
MPKEALILIIFAAFFHTGWNFVAKRAPRIVPLIWWAFVLASLLCLPFFFAHLPVPGEIWPYALASAAAEAFYLLAMARAYGRGDFSLVYPIARGAAPALLAVWSFLFLGEHFRPAGLAGLGVLVCGLSVVGCAGALNTRTSLKLSAGAVGAALFMAFWTSVYSAIDGAAVRIMAPQAYIGLVFALTALLLTPAVIRRFGVKGLASELRSGWMRILVAAALMLSAYMLVLRAFQMANVCYVAALRELSVVLAALAGWRLLGEEFGLVRTAGSILIFLGIFLISLAG